MVGSICKAPSACVEACDRRGVLEGSNSPAVLVSSSIVTSRSIVEMERKIHPKEKGCQKVSHFALCCLTDAVRTPSRSDQLEKGLLIVANRWCQRRPAHHVSWSQRNHQTSSDIAVKHIQLSNSIPDRHSVHELDWVPS